MDFDKLLKTHKEQLDLLISRGLIVNNRDFALHCLSRVNYYRLTAYRFAIVQDYDFNEFKPNSTFQHMWNYYDFDRKLRNLFMDAIEKVEVALRTSWSYQLAIKHGSHAYTDVSIFKSSLEHTKMLSKLDGDVGDRVYLYQ